MNVLVPLDALVEFLTVTVRSATPILLAGLGLLFMARSGVVNIGGEGMMLIGALAGVAGSYYSGSEWVGLLAAAASAGLSGLLFAYFVVSLRANQMVTGTALNVLGLGLTSSVTRMLFGLNTAPPQIATFHPWTIVCLALAAVPLAHAVLFWTPAGLALRATGEHPKAADTVGVDVFRVRYTAIVAGAMLAGAGGAHLSLGLVSFFAENMVAGRGFMALAAVIFGKYTPLGTLAAALLFGAGEALEFKLQAAGAAVPQEFLLMLPYVLTVAALAGLVGRSAPPAALGRPYAKE